jgi:hypothetical protein
VAVEGLLGGEVVGGAEDVLVVLLGDVVLLVVEEPGQAHVEDLHDPGAVEEDVAGLDVAVDQAHLMGVLEADGRGVDVVARPEHVELAELLDEVLEVGAVHVLHDEEVEVLVLVDVVGADDVRVVHGGDGAGLAVEPLEAGRVVGLGGREHLDGDPPPHHLVLAEEHLGHAPGPELLEHLVLADREPLVLALEELLGLEVGEDAVLHEDAGQALRVGRDAPGAAHLLEAGPELGLVGNPTPLDQFQELVGVGGGGIVNLSAGAGNPERRPLKDNDGRYRPKYRSTALQLGDIFLPPFSM